MKNLTYKLTLCLLLICFVISSYAQPDPCQKKIDSLTWVIKAKDYRLNRVRFYVKLVDKKPSQIKFLKGWIKRAVN